jgi:hypothetical protein
MNLFTIRVFKYNAKSSCIFKTNERITNLFLYDPVTPIKCKSSLRLLISQQNVPLLNKIFFLQPSSISTNQHQSVMSATPSACWTSLQTSRSLTSSETKLTDNYNPYIHNCCKGDIIIIIQLWFDITTNRRVLTRWMDIIYVTKDGGVFASAYCVYYASINNILMWIYEMQYTI